MLNSSGTNDLQLGSSLMTHPRSWSQYTHPNLGFDINEPFVMIDWGILFKEERYLTTIPVNTFYSTWMLEHPHYFTIEAWVRKDEDDYYEWKMN